MSLLRQPIERKLSAVIGAEVTFEKFKFSLLGGSLEASGITIAGGDDHAPLLTVRRIKAEISVAKALAKQFVIKSLTIEGPVISILRREDGSTNLPQRQPADPVTEPSAPVDLPEEHAASLQPEPTWRLETQKVTLIDGQIHFRDQTAGSPYHASAEQITLDLRQIDDKVAITAGVENVGRRDRPISLGTIHISANFNDVADLARLHKSPMEAKVELTGGLVAMAATTSLAPGEISLNLQGPLDLPEWIAVLPPSLPVPVAFTSPGFTGRANISLKLLHDFAAGTRIQEFVLRVSEARIPASSRTNQP